MIDDNDGQCNYVNNDISKSNHKGKQKLTCAEYRSMLDLRMCQICNECFSSKTKTRKHIHDVHLGESFACLICDYTSSNIGEAKPHVKWHFGRNEGKTGRMILKFPMGSKFKDGRFSNSSLFGASTRIGTTSNGVRQDRKQLQAVSRLLCPICNVIIPRRKFLKMHFHYTHIQVPPPACAVCNVTFATAEEGKEHVMFHWRRDILANPDGGESTVNAELSRVNLPHRNAKLYTQGLSAGWLNTNQYCTV
jgi:hypothetical protein